MQMELLVHRVKLVRRGQLALTGNRMVTLTEEKQAVCMAELVHYWAEMQGVSNGSADTA